MRWPTLSIRASVLLAIAVAVVLPALALLQIDQRLTRQAHEPLIAQHRQAVLAMTAAALVEPIWTIDERLVQSTAKRALNETSVLQLRISERRAQSEPFVLANSEAATDHSVRLQTAIAREGEALGELEIWFDARPIDRVLAERRTTTLQLAAAQVVLGIAVLLAVMYWRLLVPIERLKQQASQIATRAEMVPVRWNRKDELGELGHHLNDVHHQIDALFEQLEQQKAELEKIALHDGLTGLPNRSLFGELTQAAVSAARRDHEELALLFVDLDRFKAVNDTLGHSAGDTVLVTMAARLRAAVRSSDVVCRHSGDEFTVLLRGVAHWDEVASLADRLLKEMETPVHVHQHDITVSASIGISMFPHDARDHEELLRHADTAMYAAKNLGRARFSFFRSEYNTQLQATLHLERELQQALHANQFVLHYQPQVSADALELVGCEALIRWLHPQRGMLAPAQFIGQAEQCGLISEIGAWALRAACAQIARWKSAGVPFGTVSVNVSALEFRHHRLVDTLTRAMADHGVLPHELEIELTESVLMTDTDTTQRIVDRLNALGLRLAVDDFGTGYSSLSYLKRLRPSKIKIDRSFVRDLPDDEDDCVLVQAIVQLATALGIRVVAEGVETVAQRDYLRRIGCGMLQGFLISKPQPADAFARFALSNGHALSTLKP